MRLWDFARGDTGALPEAGGSLAQAAIMLEALQTCSVAFHEIETHYRKRQRGGR